MMQQKRQSRGQSRTLRKTRHAQSAPALHQNHNPYGDYQGPHEVRVEQQRPGMLKSGFINNRLCPIDPINGDERIPLSEYKLALQEKEDTRGGRNWSTNGVQARGYGTCYPGEVPAPTYHDEYQKPRDPYFPVRRHYDVVTGREMPAWAPTVRENHTPPSARRRLSHEYERDGLPPVALRPRLRPTNILSWKAEHELRFQDGLVEQPEDGPNPSRHQSFIPNHAYKVATKVGFEKLKLREPPQRMYGVVNKVGGDRPHDFVRRDAERRQRRRDTASKPHVHYG